MKKSALVFGCTGQDGQYLTKSLLQQNYEVIGVSRSDFKKGDKQNLINNENKYKILSGDVCDIHFISYLIDFYSPCEVYNLAAQSSVGISFKKPVETFRSIVDGSRSILEAARLLNYQGNIFFAGSSEMYGETKKAAVLETRHSPVSPYGLAKSQSFELVKFYRKFGNLKCRTGILFNHESPLRDSRFVTHKIIEGAITASRNKSFKLKIGNLKVFRDWGWAEEYVKAMQIINRSDCNKDYIICTGKINSLERFAEKAFNLMNLNWYDHVEIDQSLFRLNDIKKSFGNPNSLYEDLGWKTSISFDKLIEKLLHSKLSGESNLMDLDNSSA